MSAKTKKLCLLAVGISLFVVLSLCLQVPVFENYYLCLGYVVMAVYCWCFGTLSGTVVGFFGVILYCLVISGLRGMPGWALGNIVIGLSLGTAFKVCGKWKSAALRSVCYVAVIIISSAAGILVVKSLTESLLYAQPFLLRAGKNIYAFAADAVMLTVSLPICAALDKPARRLFPSLCAARTAS